MVFKSRNKWLAYEQPVENNRYNTMQRFNYERKEAGKDGNIRDKISMRASTRYRRVKRFLT